MPAPLKVFISYSHNNSDRPLLDAFLRQAKPLVLAGHISIWEDGRIAPGDIWEEVILKHLNAADIVVMLVSSDYLASDYINNVEAPLAMQRQSDGLCQVVPVLLRNCLFELMPYAKYEFLPKNPDNHRLTPVENWSNTDDAFAVVVRRLHTLIQQINGTSQSPVAEKPDTAAAISDLERKGNEQQLHLATQKLQRLQTAHLIETDESKRFAYEQEIQKLEILVNSLKTKS